MSMYIDADKLTKNLKSVVQYGLPESDGTHLLSAEVVLQYISREATTTDVAPVVHGHWGRSRFTLQDRYQEQCSVCENWSSDYGRYCTYCGARMDECEASEEETV